MTLTSKDGNITFEINDAAIQMTITDSNKDAVYYVVGTKTIAKKKDENGNEYGELLGNFSAVN